MSRKFFLSLYFIKINTFPHRDFNSLIPYCQAVQTVFLADKTFSVIIIKRTLKTKLQEQMWRVKDTEKHVYGLDFKLSTNSRNLCLLYKLKVHCNQRLRQLISLRKQTFATPPPVCPRTTSVEIPCWWRITTQIWIVLLTGWSKISLVKRYPDLGSDTSSVWNCCSCSSDVISELTQPDGKGKKGRQQIVWQAWQ